MKYDFDEEIDRRYTEATKWDQFLEISTTSIPLWIADMDLRTSKAIENALIKRASHPIYGYSDRNDKYNQLIAERFNQQHEYGIEKEDIILSTGVMYSINASIQLFTKKNDKIIIFTPCYYPFRKVIEENDRILYDIPLRVNERYEIDFDTLESINDASVTAMILCNPHNPTGRILEEYERKRLAIFCEKHKILIVADEIHSDFDYDNKFQTILNTSEYTKQNTICCVSPTKAFNLAGIKISAAIIKNKDKARKFQSHVSLIGINSINVFAMEACKAAYLHSADWQRQLLDYLQINRTYAYNFINKNLPDAHVFLPDGTYFLWVDINEYLFTADELQLRIIQEADVIISPGIEFSKQTLGYIRINFASPRAKLEIGLFRLQKWLLMQQ